jgi:phosphopantothenoylcysteine synthetase/decarboxylase
MTPASKDFVTPLTLSTLSKNPVHSNFYNEDDDKVEVMNMIPKHHLDSLHKNPSDETRRIKRADD